MGPPPPRAPAGSRLQQPNSGRTGLPNPLPHANQHVPAPASLNRPRPPSRIPGRPQQPVPVPAAAGKPPRSPMALAAARKPPRSPIAAILANAAHVVHEPRSSAYAHFLPGEHGPSEMSSPSSGPVHVGKDCNVNITVMYYQGGVLDHARAYKIQELHTACI